MKKLLLSVLLLCLLGTVQAVAEPLAVCTISWSYENPQLKVVTVEKFQGLPPGQQHFSTLLKLTLEDPIYDDKIFAYEIAETNDGRGVGLLRTTYDSGSGGWHTDFGTYGQLPLTFYDLSSFSNVHIVCN